MQITGDQPISQDGCCHYSVLQYLSYFGGGGNEERLTPADDGARYWTMIVDDSANGSTHSITEARKNRHTHYFVRVGDRPRS